MASFKLFSTNLLQNEEGAGVTYHDSHQDEAATKMFSRTFEVGSPNRSSPQMRACFGEIRRPSSTNGVVRDASQTGTSIGSGELRFNCLLVSHLSENFALILTIALSKRDATGSRSCEVFSRPSRGGLAPEGMD